MFISFEIILLCREFKQYLLNRSIDAVFIFIIFSMNLFLVLLIQSYFKLKND